MLIRYRSTDEEPYIQKFSVLLTFIGQIITHI
uniref:Uncharacterized protein n=1 Tax=Arundo donax TaxID=35708 RepID=A0A0A8ZCA5_ARUDO